MEIIKKFDLREHLKTVALTNKSNNVITIEFPPEEHDGMDINTELTEYLYEKSLQSNDAVANVEKPISNNISSQNNLADTSGSLIIKEEIPTNDSDDYIYLENETIEDKNLKEKQFFCQYCHKGFTRSDHLKSHVRIHTGEKPYVCSWCNMGFKKSHHLKNHVRTHTGERPFLCTICEKSFVRKHHLKKHLSTHVKKDFGSLTQHSLLPPNLPQSE